MVHSGSRGDQSEAGDCSKMSPRERTGAWLVASGAAVAHAASAIRPKSPLSRMSPPPAWGTIWAGIALQRKRLVSAREIVVSGAMNDEVPLAPAQPKKPGANQLLIDLGPIAVFVVAFNVLQRLESTKDNAVYIATAIFIASTLAAIGYCKLRQGRIPPVLIVTGVLVTCFGGLTLLLHDENYIKIKPTFVYFFYAAAIT